MTDHVRDKVILITGAGSGFGRLVALAVAARGARVGLADVQAEALEATRREIVEAGGRAFARETDVTRLQDMQALAQEACDSFGAIDVMINNAGTMPLAFYADHARAAEAWDRCIDVNVKGVLYGMIAVHDQMISQGRGHIVNISSIYGNYPVAGAAVYGATKAAVNTLSESLRIESQGRIKVTIVKPTGVPATNLAGGVINPAAVVGILGHNAERYLGKLEAMAAGQLPPEELDPDNVAYAVLDPSWLAEQILHAIDQPWGVSIGEITVRASGDGYVL